jgi:hypothetical protein
MNTSILNKFENVTSEFVSTLASFSKEQFNLKPACGGWTPAQVGEHMNKSHGLSELLNGAVTDTQRDPAQFEPMLRDTFLNFETKMQSPDFVVPEEKEYDQQQLIHSLSGKINASKEAISNLDLSKTCTAFALPGSEPYTRMEWIYFLIYHTQRHLHQLNKIKAGLEK